MVVTAECDYSELIDLHSLSLDHPPFCLLLLFGCYYQVPVIVSAISFPLVVVESCCGY